MKHFGNGIVWPLVIACEGQVEVAFGAEQRFVLVKCCCTGQAIIRKKEVQQIADHIPNMPKWLLICYPVKNEVSINLP